MNIKRKPEWLKTVLPDITEEYAYVRNIVTENRLHTICQSGNCPNMSECWRNGTATFMILGDICTRACRFCNVKTGRPLPPDESEPARIAESVRLMKLTHCVITSVDRDDLPDGGAGIWAATIKVVKQANPGTTIETLIPDFEGKEELLGQIIDSAPEIISHNLETVERLTKPVRLKAKYDRSLRVLEYLARSGAAAKSGIMLGLGETEEEVLKTMDDLASAGVSIMTLGQYLQPTKNHLPVADYITPQKFLDYKIAGLGKGFKVVESGPLVRSSYHADKHILKNVKL
jgi:lipoic acid synthetase